MAWISVHESIDGPKLRRLYKTLECSKFEAAGILNFLWFWGLGNADSSGRIQDADREDIERYLYGVGAGCGLDIKQVVSALFSTGWIDEDDDGNLFLHDWDTWQEQWYKAKLRRDKDTERQRESREMLKAIKAGARVAKEELPPVPDDSESPPEVPPDNPPEDPPKVEEPEEPKVPAAPTGPPEPPAPPEQPIAKKYSAAFEVFWNEYPRKDEKAGAYAKYRARLKDGWSEDELLRAAKNYAFVVRKDRTEKRYIKQAKTFLSESTPFIDFLPKKKPEQKPTQVASSANPFAEYEEDAT